MTKPIAGVALMTFYEEGRFGLDDPVAKFIPEFAELKVAKAPGPDGQPEVEDADHQMTIRELASHTAGLTYGFFSRSQVDTLYVQANVLDRASTLKEMIVKLRDIPCASSRAPPGTTASPWTCRAISSRSWPASRSTKYSRSASSIPWG